jgi:hypothetical protein
MTLTEKYWTTSFPQPVYKTVSTIYHEGAKLTRPESVDIPKRCGNVLTACRSSHIPVSPAAPGLFGLPALILAMYRSVSPLYYTDEPGGNMYLYNDAVWLSEKLRDFALDWKNQEDLPPRAYGMVKLDPEIKILESFGKRAYTNELNAQRTIINDLLAGKSWTSQLEVGRILSVTPMCLLSLSTSAPPINIPTKAHKTSFSKAMRPTKASVMLRYTYAPRPPCGRRSFPTQPGHQQQAPSSTPSQPS